MAYGTVKVDNITFTNGGIDQTITVSGIVQSISGNITATGTIQGQTIIGTSTVSGATVTGDAGLFTTTTAATGIFTSQISGATITGNVGSFTTITGGTVTLTSGVFASGTAAAPSVSIGTTDNGLYSPGADQVAVATNGTQRITVDASGRLLVGTSTSRDSNCSLQIVNDSTATFECFSGRNDNYGPGVILVKSRGTTSSPTAVSSGDELGGLRFRGYDGANYISGAEIKAEVDGTPGAYDMPSRIVLSTTADGTSSPTERLRITSAGLVGIGTSAPTEALSVVGTLVSTGTTSSAFFSSGNDVQGGNNPTFTMKVANSLAGFLKWKNAAGTDHWGIYSVMGAAGQQGKLAFRDLVGGEDRMVITPAGLVGIGTTTVSDKLHVADGNITFSYADGSTGLRNKISWRTESPFFDETAYIAVNRTGVSGAPADIVLATGGAGTATEKARITSAGLVGIGTSSPGVNLQVNAASDVSIALSNSSSVTSGNRGSISMFNSAISTVGLIRFGAVTDNVGTDIQFYTRPAAGSLTQSMTLDSTGRLGIGVTAPADTLHVRGPVSGTILNLDRAGSYSWKLGQSSGSDLTFTGDINERVRFTADGKVLVGTSSTSKDFSAVFQGNSADATGGANLLLARGTSSPADGSAIGYLSFTDSNHNTTAQIQAQRDGGTWTSGTSQPGRLVFSTTENGASSPTERMRITKDGYLKQSPTGSYLNATGLHNEFNANNANSYVVITSCTNASPASEYIQDFRFTAATPNNTSARFWNCADATAVRAYMASNGGLYNYSANNSNLSDRNAKKDITPAADTWDCIKEWEIVNYRYKDQPDTADLNLGVIAQQVAESCPEVIAVFQEAKEATEDQPAQEERLGVKEQQMYWMAIKALQEAQVRIEQLEQRLTDAGIA
jgi:hypothetical protein